MLRTFAYRALLLLLVLTVTVAGTSTPALAAVAADPPPADRPIPAKDYPGWDGESGLGEPVDPRYWKLVSDIAQYSEEPEVREAAEAALALGTDDALFEFFHVGEPDAQARAQARRDETARVNREKVLDLRGTGGPIFNAEVERVLAGSDSDRAAFLDYGKTIAADQDERARQATQARADELRTRVTVLVRVAGPEVQRAAQSALDAGDAAIAAFLNGGYLEAAKRDAAANEQHLKELEERTKAAEQASDLAKRAARASQARRNLVVAHGRGVRSLQRAANAMTSAATAGRQAAQILAANNASGNHSPGSFSLVKQEAARQFDFAQQATGEARAAAVAATAEADILVETGLPYGADWAKMAQGMASAAQAAVSAIETVRHTIDATMATDAAIGDQAKATARAEEARRWRLLAEENARAAASLSAAAKDQVKAAEDAAVRARAALDDSIRAVEAAWAGEWETQATLETAKRERDKAKASRQTAELERDKAASYRRDADEAAADAREQRGRAEAFQRAATDARHRAETQEGIARGCERTAEGEERKAVIARDRAWAAKRDANTAEARAQALEASAAAARGTAQEAPAWAAAQEARRDADDAASAADAAQGAANLATAAAARAREAATKATAAAAASRAAAEEAAEHAANADLAASQTEATAAGVHNSAMQANAAAATATSAEVQAAANARTAGAQAAEAVERARVAAISAVNAQRNADEAQGEADSAATQAGLASRASVAARASAAAITDPANTAIIVVAPFTGTDLDADFVTEVARQSQAVGEEQSRAAEARAAEAQTAATQAQQAADQAAADAKAAFQASADAAKSAHETAVSAAKAQRAAQAAHGWASSARSNASQANSADARAHANAVEARNAANEASQDAAIAGLAADTAEGHAEAARGAASQAEADATKARAAAEKARIDARAAADAAERARIHAQNTSAAATRAREAAADAQHAVEQSEAADRQREAERRQTEAMVLAGCLPGLTVEDIDDLMGDDQSAAALGEYRAAQQGCMNGDDVTSFLFEVGGEVLLEFIGIPDLKRCFGSGNIEACLWTVVNVVGLVLPFIKGKAIIKAVGAVVVNIGKYLAKSELIRKIGAKVLSVLDKIRRVCRATSRVAQRNGAGAAGFVSTSDVSAAASSVFCFPLKNLRPEDLADELLIARLLNVAPVAVGTADFLALVRDHSQLKWAVLTDGRLVVIPKYVQDTEIKHPVLSGGADVRSVGEMTVHYNGTTLIISDFNLHSGHYDPPRSGSRYRGYYQIGKEAFEALGYFIP
ncbi:hypothetical protein [Amycolatopsis sp. lyj-84]|uniref:ALF repeat-containing protein n=1 Tax=Amycolatopsis sp. lyj-84 TaxID=2789284 RepID=UPI00397E3C56